MNAPTKTIPAIMRDAAAMLSARCGDDEAALRLARELTAAADVVIEQQQALALAYTWICEAKAYGVALTATNTLAACRAALERGRV